MSGTERRERKNTSQRKYYAANRDKVYAANREYVRAYRAANREKLNTQAATRRAKNRGKIRAGQRKCRGLPAPTRPPPATCECCGRPPDGRGSLHLDHDHITGKFRGWLRASCNLSIGRLGDNIAGLQQAIDYLKRFEADI